MSCFGFYQVKHDNTKERYKDEENEVGVTQGFCNCKIVGNEVVEKKGDKTENKKIHPLVPCTGRAKRVDPAFTSSRHSRLSRTYVQSHEQADSACTTIIFLVPKTVSCFSRFKIIYDRSCLVLNKKSS